MTTQKGSAVLRYLLFLFLVTLATAIAIMQSPDENRSERSFSLADLLGYRGWMFPIEFSPQARLPFIGGGLRSIALSPSERTIWIAGDSGELLLSKDGAKSWEPKTAKTTSHIRDVLAVTDESVLIMTIDNKVRVTQDSGAHWSVLELDDASDKFMEWDFERDAKKLWVITQKGMLLSSSILSPSSEWKLEGQVPHDGSDKCESASVSIGSKHHSVLFSCNATVYYKKDGVPWTALVLPENIETNYLSTTYISKDGDTLWLGGLGKAWSKTWSAEKWTTHSLPLINDKLEWVHKFIFAPQGSTLFVISAGSIFRSDDQGATWKQVADFPHIISMAITRAGQVLVVSGDGGVFDGRLQDDTWTRRAVGSAGSFRRIIPHPSALDEFLILSSTGRILETHGGGRSLSSFREPIPAESVMDIVARKPNEVWRVGLGGLSTPDSGKFESKIDLNITLNSIRFDADGKKGLIGSDTNGIFISVNSGEKWRPVFNRGESEKIDSINELFFSPDGKRAWAISSGGFILSSASDIELWDTTVWNKDWYLQSVWFIGELGWIAGEDGLILSSVDGGKNWIEQKSGTTEFLYRIRFASDGQHGWAVGNGGTILTTKNGGKDWLPTSSGTKVNLRDIIADDKSKQVWVVGWGGTLLRSDDGGLTWNRTEGIKGATYRRFPAPWFWLLLAIVIWLAWSRARESTVGQSTTIPAIAVSDNPITEAREDRFNFQQLAQAISQFVRNVNTRPPFVVALTGQWGSGKSSIMHLLQTDLQETGYQPVWWNAWHYQDEGSALASAMEHIRRQSMPTALPANLRLRWRLLHKRLLRPIAPLLLALAALLATMAWMSLAAGHNGIENLLDQFLLDQFNTLDLKSTEEQFNTRGLENPNNQDNWLERGAYMLTAAGVASIGGLLYWLAQMMKPFSGQSKRLAALWGNISTSAQVRSLPDDVGVRYRFAKEFSELTDALAPTRVVVIIDDLDRCHPDHVVNVLETVNFLVTSGKCIVILGIDKERVLAAVSVKFENVAKATPITELVNGNASDSPNYSPAVAFARSYIRKMINLEVRVPTLGLDIHRLMFGLDTSELPQPLLREPGQFEVKVALKRLRLYFRHQLALTPERLRNGMARLRLFPGLMLTQVMAEFPTGKVPAFAKILGRIALPLAIGWFIGQQLVLQSDEMASRHQSKNKSESVSTEPIPSAASKNLTLPIPNADSSAGSAHSVAPDTSTIQRTVVYIPANIHPAPATVAVILGLLAMFAIVSIWQTYFSGPVQDSRAFELAMKHWSQEISQHLVTPREMKRFLNRVRFAALRIRVERQRETNWEFITRLQTLARRAWALGLEPRTQDETQLSGLAIDEETLVRLAAYQVCGHDMRLFAVEDQVDQRDVDHVPAEVPEKLSDLDARLAELLFLRRNATERAAALKAYEAILGGVQY